MKKETVKRIEEARKAAIEVLLHNARGPYYNLPRTAGWGYPEPYTRDLLISSLGILVSENKKLIKVLRRVLETLASNQSRLGHIPSLVHDKKDRGASDTTPLFLLAVGFFREATGEAGFLSHAVNKALTWMEYQSPSDRALVAQQPTSDWRDEQWVLGFGLYVNTLVYSFLRVYNNTERAGMVRNQMSRFTIRVGVQNRHVHEGLAVRNKPYYALWSYKIHSSERFDLLGNSLAILSGIASQSRANDMIVWIERECEIMRIHDELGADLPPSLFPFIKPQDPDWRPRYKEYNQPGEYHNGGVWPFLCGFYIAALVAVKRYQLAEQKLEALTELIEAASLSNISHGFNEWLRARDGEPMGEDWQSWSAAMYLYAVKCVEEKKTPFFEEIRSRK